MLCITDGVPAGSTENTQFDVTSSLKTVTKWFGYIDRPERTPEFMRRAFSMLRSGRPGPVVLAVPNSAGIYDETADPYFPVRAYKSAPDPSDVVRAIDLLMDAANPLIYAGEGVIYAGASEQLVGLAELLNAPVITTLKAKGAFPENHPLFVGVRGEHPIAYLNKSDVILTVGSSLSPGPVHPRHPQRGREDHHPVQPGRLPPEPHLPDASRGAGRRQVRPYRRWPMRSPGALTAPAGPPATSSPRCARRATPAWPSTARPWPPATRPSTPTASSAT